MARIRIQRLESELLKIISNTINFKLRDKNLNMITITQVTLSNDLSHARIYFTHLSKINSNKILQSLQKSSGFIKNEIACAKFMRVIPELVFNCDKVEEKARHLDELFAKIHADSENKGKE